MFGPSRLKRAQLCCCSLCALVANGAGANTTESQRAVSVASYTLQARLDTDSHRVDAKGEISFTNRSDVPVHELWFHLYPNAFSSERTRFWRTANATRRSLRSLYDRGRLDIGELTMRGDESTNLWSSADATTPGDPDDATDRRVPLPVAVQPGETIVLNVRFVTQLPFIVERLGWVETFHAVAQWFPKLAKLESDGTWRHFPYEALAEFYADFGDYDIRIDVPRTFTVAAPGQSSVLSQDNQRTVTRFQMSNVHDFAWFAWDHFRCIRSSAAQVEIRTCVPPGHSRNALLEANQVAAALPGFEAMFGTYPYRELVVVHPPDVAAPAGGMEYPGLIVTGAPWYASFTGTRALSAVTVHELAHQWFYGIVATDEARYPVLDEGLASWAELTALSDEYGVASAFSGLGVSLSASAVAQLMGTNGYKPGPLASSATSFATFSRLTHSVYARMTLLLQTLGNVYGQQKLRAALHRYALDNRFEHPGPEALVSAFKNEMGHEAAANLERALHSDGWVDYAPSTIETEALDAEHWKSTIRVHRSGTLNFPAQVTVTLADGQVQSHLCQFNDPDCAFEVHARSRVASVTVDPRRSVVIEAPCANNTMWSSTAPKPWRLMERLVYFFQLIIGELVS